MAIETEVKIPVDEETFNRLYHNEYRPSSFVIQRILMYSFGESFLRLRQEHNATILTVKGPRPNGELNIREEIESRLCDNIFDELKKSIPNAFYYEKKRATSMVPYCIICFDILDDGRKYIEIESKIKGEIYRHRKRLGLDKHPVEKRSYLEILRKVKNGS